MRTGIGSSAYTITETLIFLAVSSLLFTFVAVTVQGRQAQTEFTQAVSNFESRLLDLANDVSTGYYENTQNFGCTVTPGGPVITGAATTQGTNTGCILAGQVIGFTNDSRNYTISPLAGLQKNAVGREVTSAAEAMPRAVTVASFTEMLAYGAVVNRVKYDAGAGSVTMPSGSGVVLMTTFGSYGDSGVELTPGDISADTYPINSTTSANISAQNWAATPRNPSGGITICIQDGVNPTKHADLILGGNGRQLTTRTVFAAGACT